MAAKHKNPSRPDRTAVAPYNFVPVPDRPITYPEGEKNPLAVDQSVYHASRFTGWIDVDLETRSPIYVRGPLTPEQYERKEIQDNDPRDPTPHLEKLRNRPDFFHAGDPQQPVIPGSSLRGMLRTICEILGHGKMNFVHDTALIYRAVGDTSSHGEAYRQQLMAEVPGEKNHFVPRFKAGYIVHNGRDWAIQPAQEINGVTYARISHKRWNEVNRQLKRWYNCRNAREIYVQIGPNEMQKVRGGFIHIKYAKVLHAAASPGAGLHRAVAVESGRMFSKRSEAVIFAPDENAPKIRIPDGSNGEPDLVTAYLDQVSPEQEKLLGSKQGVLQHNQPIFYLEDEGKLIFFGHTQMFRLPYRYSPQGLLHPVHKDENRIDLAEAMFGKVRAKETGHAGRIFVGDARMLPGQANPWLPDGEITIPQILSGPKPTTFQHYLTQPQPDVAQGKGLETYNSSPKNTTLRGYKLYWHKGDVRKEAVVDNLSAEEQKKDTQHTKMKPIRSGVQFSFRVHFENLLAAELGLLWWALALPGQGDYCHKLGMGKPLGLGAVKLSPALHLVQPAKRYQSFLAPSEEALSTGEAAEDIVNQRIQQVVNMFEKFIKIKLGHTEDTPFTRLERVKMLLQMLSWPGPDPEQTRYMEIERSDPKAKRGKRNEYKDRPVLPDPLHVE